MGRRRKKKGKIIAQQKHAYRRASQRYDLELKEHEYNEINGQIRKQRDAKCLYRQSNRVTVWKVKFKDKELFVVYDKKRNQVVTFLKKEMVENDMMSNSIQNI